MRQVSHVLRWSHYFEILKPDAPLEISFYALGTWEKVYNPEFNSAEFDIKSKAGLVVFQSIVSKIRSKKGPEQFVQDPLVIVDML